ncbi:twin-arginine translocation signal domain-containing protein [Allopusillimonas soli]|uniref:TRAP transporter substrate-binding protein n=1 Tax=Allopusillimonas soli TaxID=659016 RepID=A0A853FD97_9BURK|nr:TRAP transporter substrate-binding protein [Allopusillimonas soli]NYT37708.1 TRAP transporter substrate-binding protein [Allopusillimonas soli]TEA74344.1 twin-arginine translocation signal domain-containing protein [Allopusillimonas soli]
MQRRSFLKNAALGAAAGGATLAAPVFAQDAPTLSWRLASSFPRSADAIYSGGENLAKYVSEATGGKFSIRAFPAGEIVPALAVLDSVQNGTVEAGHTASYYYFGKDPALCFDSAVPFGLNTRQMNAWVNHGGGMDLLRAMYKKYNIVNFPCGYTGTQMGGWFRKEIKTVADLDGLKFRCSAFAGEVLSRLGVVPQQIAGGDIYPSLEKGTIDAAEWIGPYDDEKQGFHRVAPYYYFPGWWEGTLQVSLYLNQDKFNALPKSYQNVLAQASAMATNQMIATYDAENPKALKRLIGEGAKLRAFPKEVMEASYNEANKVYAEMSAKDPQFKTLLDSFMSFRNETVPWLRVGEGSFDQFMAAVTRK